MIVGVFLAAGRSERFGSDKLLHDLHGSPLVCHSLSACIESALPRIFIVIETGNDRLRSVVERTFPETNKLEFLGNDFPEAGLMSSLKVGIEAAGDGCDAVMVCLADMPRITAGIINTLLSAWEVDKIVVPVCGGRGFHPRIIPKRLFPDFLQLPDDAKGLQVMDKYPHAILQVPVGEADNYTDIDTLSDLDRAGRP